MLNFFNLFLPESVIDAGYKTPRLRITSPFGLSISAYHFGLPFRPA